MGEQDKYHQLYNDDDQSAEPNDPGVEYDEYGDLITDDEPPVGRDVGGSDDEPDLEDKVYRTQEEFDAAFERRLRRMKKKIASDLGGFNTLEEAKEWVDAGRSVSEASGLTPAQIKLKLEEDKMRQGTLQTGQVQVSPYDAEVKRELARMNQMLETDREEKARRGQEVEAKKEFGELFDKHREDIEDKAEELGLSLVDAGAIVLRSKLRAVAEEKVRTKTQLQRQRKIESSDEGPGGSPVDYNTALTAEQKRVARKMGRTLESYYKQLKTIGEI